MTKELEERFRNDVESAMRNVLDYLSNDDTRAYFLANVVECSIDEDSPYMLLFTEIQQSGWDWQIVDEELPYIVDSVADEFIDIYPSVDNSNDELQMYEGGYDDEELEQNGLEIITWSDSQLLMELPRYRQHCYLINDEDGLETYGSSAYVVETHWLDGFRDDNFTNL